MKVEVTGPRLCNCVLPDPRKLTRRRSRDTKRKTRRIHSLRDCQELKYIFLLVRWADKGEEHIYEYHGANTRVACQIGKLPDCEGLLPLLVLIVPN